MTFDDLPVVSVTLLDKPARREITGKLLNTIAAHEIPATGFVNEYGLYGFAREPQGAPDPAGVSLLRMWIDAGFELGNHTFAHSDLHALSVSAFEADVARGEAVTGELLASKGLRLRYFRHPYLHTGTDLGTRRQVERFLATRGYRVAPVTVDNEDWLFAAAYSKAAERGDRATMQRVADAYVSYTERAFEYSEGLSSELFKREIRQVMLVHANALNADFFEAVARMMERRQYSFISLDAALADAAYESVDTYTGEESINWLARWAITRGIRNPDNVLDGFPDVPEFVQTAAALEP